MVGHYGKSQDQKTVFFPQFAKQVEKRLCILAVGESRSSVAGRDRDKYGQIFFAKAAQCRERLF